MLYITNVKLQNSYKIDWTAINWKKINKRVNQIRNRIYRASKEGNLKKARNLQKLMMKSVSNKLLAIRKITQINQGKNTPGIDRIKVTTNCQRENLYDKLNSYSYSDIKPVKRVYIPKKGRKSRPLGLPTIIDRCKQVIVKSALEPYWEAKFERKSYGFRPGRSTKDAICRVFMTVRTNLVKHWVLDADIKGAFDNIYHNSLLKCIGNFPGRKWIEHWLKIGIVENGKPKTMSKGTPQGGVISPLLLNIVLHGLEEVLNIEYYKDGTSKDKNQYAIVRYADDIVVFGTTKASLEEVKPKITEWLKSRGLELSKQKTQIKHLEEGFNFLGFNIRHFTNNKKKQGKVCWIKPSKESIMEFKKEMRKAWKKVIGIPTKAGIEYLNPKIRGWGQYYRNCNAKETFSYLDHWMWKRQSRYCYRRHPNKKWWWKYKKYWGKYPGRKDRWVFMDKATGTHLWKLAWVPVKRHCMVKGDYSPDNPDLKKYWEKRQKRKSIYLRGIRHRLWIRQEGKCAVCKIGIDNGEEIHMHHIIQKKDGGDDMVDNLALLHKICHKQIHGKSKEQIKL